MSQTCSDCGKVEGHRNHDSDNESGHFFNQTGTPLIIGRKARTSRPKPHHRCSLCGRDGRVLDVDGHCTMRSTCAKSVAQQAAHERRARLAELVDQPPTTAPTHDDSGKWSEAVRAVSMRPKSPASVLVAAALRAVREPISVNQLAAVFEMAGLGRRVSLVNGGLNVLARHGMAIALFATSSVKRGRRSTQKMYTVLSTHRVWWPTQQLLDTEVGEWWD